MPLTDQLGEEVARRVDGADQSLLPARGPSGERFTDGRFEEWLSYLAEDQPHLDQSARFRNRALLNLMTLQLTEVMTEMQLQAMASHAPDWLYELLMVLHLARATVITTNYDNLVECAVSQGVAPLVNAGGRWLPLDEDDILEGRPRRADYLRFGDLVQNLEQAGSGFRMSPLITARELHESSSARERASKHSQSSNSGVAVSPNGTVYLSDTGNGRVRTVLPDGDIETVAGGGQQALPARQGTEIAALSASLGTPAGLAFGPGHQLYVAANFIVRLRRPVPSRGWRAAARAGPGYVGRQAARSGKRTSTAPPGWSLRAMAPWSLPAAISPGPGSPSAR